MIHFQGNCTYNMASSKASAVDLPAFNVYTSNERRHGNPHVSYPKYLEVHVFNHVIRLDQRVTVCMVSAFNSQPLIIKPIWNDVSEW